MNNKYKNELDNVKPSEELIRKTINNINERQSEKKSIFTFKRLAVCACSLVILGVGGYTYYNVMNDNSISNGKTNGNVKYSPNVVENLKKETIVEVEKNVQVYSKAQSFEKVIFRKSIDSLDFNEVNEKSFMGMYMVTEFGSGAKWVKVRHTREWNNYVKFYDYLKKITDDSSIIGYVPKEGEGIKGDCVFINVYKKPSYVIKGTYAIEVNNHLTLYIPKNYKDHMYFVNTGLDKVEVYEISIKEDEKLYNEFRDFVANLGIRVPDENVENPDMNHGVIINGEQVKEDIVLFKRKIINGDATITLNMYSELVVNLKENYDYIVKTNVEFNKDYVIGEKIEAFLALQNPKARATVIVYLTKGGELYSVDTAKWVSTGKTNPVKLASGVSEISNDNADNLYVTINGKKKKIDYQYTPITYYNATTSNEQENEEADTNIRPLIRESKRRTSYSSLYHKENMDIVLTFLKPYMNMDNKVELNKEYLIAKDAVEYEYVLGQSRYAKIYYVNTNGDLYLIDSVDIVKTGEIKPQLLASNIVKLEADNADRVTAYDKNNKEYKYLNNEKAEGEE